MRPPLIESDEDYRRCLQDVSVWEPLARAALDRHGLGPASRLTMGGARGTYPTLTTGTGLVVKLFGEHFFGPESHEAELAAYELFSRHDLPVPQLVAAGEVFSAASGWSWPYLILTEVEGRPYAELGDRLRGPERRRIAAQVGRLLRRFHELPLPASGPLAPRWDDFLELLTDRRRERAVESKGVAHLPPHLAAELEDWLPEPRQLVDTRRAPVFLHGDLHDDHVFLDPGAGGISAVIDFTDVLVGDPRYDLVAVHTFVFRSDKAELGACLDSYGWNRRGNDWPAEMLAFTLLHDFNVFPAETDLSGFDSLDALADALWRQ